MRWRPGDERTRPVVVAGLILLAGVAAAVVIYIRAGSEPDSLMELSPETSKQFLRELELYGGTANVLAVQARTWLAGLWHGRRLAFTVAVLSVLVSLGYLFFAAILPPVGDEPRGDRGGNGPG